jgi:putative ATP-dependent endonuclease of OLD family
VEGETEAWLVPEFARMAGVELPVEGIRVIEFAQCGIEPLMRLADDLGISWVALADGDPAGKNYAQRVEAHLAAHPSAGEVVVLPNKDIEGYLFRSGYAEVMAKAGRVSMDGSLGKVIGAAIDRVTKPGLALIVLEAADARGPEGVPPVIRELALTAQRLARG